MFFDVWEKLICGVKIGDFWYGNLAVVCLGEYDFCGVVVEENGFNRGILWF